MAFSLSILVIACTYLLGISAANNLDQVGACITSWDNDALVCNNALACSNAPTVALGSLYTTDPPKVKARSLRKRVLDRTLRWCQIGTQTYVVAESQTPLPDEAVDISALYDRGINSCDSIIEYKEDGVIGRRFHGGKSSSVHPGGEVYLDVVDANNHQITYGVLGSALRALKDYGGSKGFGTGEWKVYDGKNEVGHISVKSVT